MDDRVDWGGGDPPTFAVGGERASARIGWTEQRHSVVVSLVNGDHA
jgi:hypothetical protein